MNMPTVLRTCDCRLICRRPMRTGHLMMAVAIVLLAFLAGFAVGERHRRTIQRPNDMEEFLRRLKTAADVGILSVNRRKLDELICIVAEAEWEDRQAEPPEGP